MGTNIFGPPEPNVIDVFWPIIILTVYTAAVYLIAYLIHRRNK